LAEQTINWQLVINGIKEATKDIETLKKQLRDVRDLKDKAQQIGNTSAYNQLAKLEEDLYRKKQKFEADLTAGRDKSYEKYLQQLKREVNAVENAERAKELAQTKAYEKYLAQQQELSNLKAKQNLQSNRQSWIDEENAIKRRSELLKQQMEALALERNRQLLGSPSMEKQELSLSSRIKQAQGESYYGSLFNSKEYEDYYKKHLPAIKQGVKELGLEFENTSKKADYLGSLGQKLRSHFNWILAGGLITGMVGIPLAIESTAREFEVLSLKIKQNLELAEQYHNNSEQLQQDIQHLGNTAAVFAMGYGANIKDVMEIQQVLSRRFKSPEELTYYTNLALIMHKLDFVAPQVAAQNLEAVILSMGLNFKQARQFIDEFSVAVHVARITGTDLLDALQRSGATFHQMNFNTAESIALVSALSTDVAKAGRNIGTSLTSLLTNIDFKKGAEALKAYNVEVYQTVDGITKMRDGADIWRDIAKTFNGLTDNQDKMNEFANAISGGKWRANDLKAILANWQEFEKILAQIKEKASPEQTTELLQTGLQSYDTKLKQLTASLEVFGVVLGNQALPSLKNMVDGLSEGIQWLIKNKEAVNDVINAIWLFTKGLIAYQTYQLLANSTLGAFVKTSWSMAATAPNFVGAIQSMSSSIAGMGMTLARTAAQMLIFMAIAESISQAYDLNKQKAAERDFTQTVTAEQSGIAGVRRSLTPGQEKVLGLMRERDEFDQENQSLSHPWTPSEMSERTRRRDEMSRKIAEAIAAEKSKNSLSDVEQMVKAAEAGMSVKDLAQQYGSVDPQDLSNKKSGVAYANPPDNTEQRKRIEIQAEYKRIMADMKISADKYAESLDDLNTKESIYGLTVATTAEKFSLMTGRIKELYGEQAKLSDERDKYQKDLEEYLAKDQEFQALAASTIPNWSNMDKASRKQYLLQNREGMQDFKTLKTLLDTIAELDVKIADTSKNTSKLQNQWQKDFLGDALNPDKQREKTLKNIDIDEAIAKTKVNKYDPLRFNQENAIQLEAEKQRYNQYKILAQQLRDEYDKLLISEVQLAQKHLEEAQAMSESKEKTEALTQATLELEAAKKHQTRAFQDNADKQKQNNKNTEESLNKQKELAEKTALEVRNYEADLFRDFMDNGFKFQNVFKRLVNDLANDAINAIFRTGKEASAATKTFGKGKNSSPVGTPTFGTGKSGKGGAKAPSTGGKSGNGGKNATGGVVNVPSIAGDDGEEVIVPTEKNTQNSKKLMDYASDKLGYYPKSGGEYSAYFKNQSLASNPMVNVEVQQNKDHIRELEKQTQVLTNMLQVMIHNLNNNQGQNTVAQPIIMKQDMSVSEFATLAAKTKSLRG
jgi:TP901 family phage tail tape measure protein